MPGIVTEILRDGNGHVLGRQQSAVRNSLAHGETKRKRTAKTPSRQEMRLCVFASLRLGGFSFAFSELSAFAGMTI
jgi:hypothetical protein